VFEAEMARRDLLAFARRCYPGFKEPRFVQYLAKLLTDLEQGFVPRLSVACPVRFGKSTLCSQVFPAWYLGRHPKDEIILVSHSEKLAVDHSRRILHMMKDEKYPFDVKIAEDSHSIQKFNTSQGGRLISLGISAAASGFGASLLLLDDICPEGASENDLEAAWKQLTEAFLPRLNPFGKVLNIGARVSSNDCTGRLMESPDAKSWTFVNLPALAEDNDPLGRQPGESLWPERFPVEELEQRRLEIGERNFSSLWQGNPLPSGGLTFRTEWLGHRYTTLPTQRANIKPTKTEENLEFFYGQKPRTTKPFVITSLDSAWSSSPSSDRTAFVTLVCDGVNIFVKDILTGRWDYPDLKQQVLNYYKAQMPDRFYVEEAASGLSLLADLRKESPIPIVGLKVGRDSKVARAESTCAWWESGKILFPNSAPWLPDTLNELQRFPSGRYDDIVDALVRGIIQIQAMLQREAVVRRQLEVASQFTWAR
jgi:predicted phage terminase large subunit-like protein